MSRGSVLAQIFLIRVTRAFTSSTEFRSPLVLSLLVSRHLKSLVWQGSCTDVALSSGTAFGVRTDPLILEARFHVAFSMGSAKKLSLSNC